MGKRSAPDNSNLSEAERQEAERLREKLEREGKIQSLQKGKHVK